MSELSIETLAARLEQLERENRWWKAALVFLVLFFLVGAIWGNKPKVVEEIRARRFLVVGVNDEITGRLGPEGLTLDESAANVMLISRRRTDATGVPSVQPYITLAGPTGSIKFAAGVLPYGNIPGRGPYVSLRRKNGNVAADLGVDHGSLSLYDEEGKLRIDLAVYSDGPGLTLLDSQMNRRAVLGSTSLKDRLTGKETKTSEASLVLSGEGGKILWRAP